MILIFRRRIGKGTKRKEDMKRRERGREGDREIGRGRRRGEVNGKNSKDLDICHIVLHNEDNTASCADALLRGLAPLVR